MLRQAFSDIIRISNISGRKVGNKTLFGGKRVGGNIQSFIQQYLLSICFVSTSFLGTEVSATNKTDTCLISRACVERDRN